MKNLLIIFGVFALSLNAGAQSSSICNITVEKTKTVVDPDIWGSTTDEDCDYTGVFKFRQGANHEGEKIKTRLKKECEISHIDCTVSKDRMDGDRYPGSEEGVFRAHICVTGTRVETIELPAHEIQAKQCEKIDVCIQDALNSHDEKLYQMAKDLYLLKKCK